jgi:excisionase family DNA binding protein
VAERKPLATPEDIAEYLGVPLQTLYQWRHKRMGPPAAKVGRHLRYRWTDVDTWVLKQAKTAV